MNARCWGVWAGLWLAGCASQAPAVSNGERAGSAGIEPSRASGSVVGVAGKAGSAAAGHTASTPGAVAGGSSGTAGGAALAAASGTSGALSPQGTAGRPQPAGLGGSSAGAAAGAGAGTGTAGAAETGVADRAGSGAGTGSPAGAAAQAGSGATSGGFSPVYRIPLRVHVAQSELTDAELSTTFDELNRIWLAQAGVCFEIEVTESDENRSDGFDFRYTAGRIPGASNANGLTQNAHAIWSIDHPQLNDAPNPVMTPTARTTAHELGHALGLAHENPPPSTDCAKPCHCVERDDDCDDYLLRSGTKGFFISPPEVEIARERAARVALPDRAPLACEAPKQNR